jgi:tetratricopeptide (TPR) repeat protein
MHRALLWRVCFAWCLITRAGLPAQTNNWSEIQHHYKRAQEALQANQDTIAIKEFQEILRLDPKNASAHANLGVIAYTQRHYVQASQEFRAALKVQPSLWSAKAFLGMSELRLGNSQEAKPLLEESFRHVQDSKVRTQVGIDLVTLYYESRDLDLAVDALRALGRTGSDEPAAIFLAYRTYSDLAAQRLARLAEVAPESSQMHLILAQALANQDDFQGAIAQYRTALEIEPQLPGAHFEVGQMILAESSGESARQEAEKEFKSALAADPKNAECDYMLGEIEWLRSKPDEALKYYRQALALRPTLVDAHIAAGKALTTLGEPDEGVQQLLEAIRLDPKNEVAHYRLSQAYRKLGRSEDAQGEMTIFRKMRDSHAPIRALYEEIQQRSVGRQTVDPNDPK